MRNNSEDYNATLNHVRQPKSWRNARGNKHRGRKEAKMGHSYLAPAANLPHKPPWITIG